LVSNRDPTTVAAQPAAMAQVNVPPDGNFIGVLNFRMKTYLEIAPAGLKIPAQKNPAKSASNPVFREDLTGQLQLTFKE
jgi:hypothetical protein